MRKTNTPCRQTFGANATVTVKTEGDILLRYRLLRCISDKELGYSTYSILVSVADGDGHLTDERFIYDVALSGEEAEEIFDTLCINTVTPSTLEECLDCINEIIR